MRYLILAVVIAALVVWLIIGLLFLLMQVVGPMLVILIALAVIGAFTAIIDEEKLEAEYRKTLDKKE